MERADSSRKLDGGVCKAGLLYSEPIGRINGVSTAGKI